MKPADPTVSVRAVEEYRARIHAAAEARMSRASAFSNEDLRAMEAAAPASVVKDLVAHGTIQGPSGAGASGLITNVSVNPGLPGTNTGGWVREAPLSNSAGVKILDRMMEQEDAKARHERMVEEARRLAGTK
jgi:hypothetical protein